MTLKKLSKEYGKSINWIRDKISQAEKQERVFNPQGIVAVADATFFNRTYGFIVFRAVHLKKNLYFKLVPYETIGEYLIGREAVEGLGFTLSAIVLDGRTGIRIFLLIYRFRCVIFIRKKSFKDI